MTVPKAGLSITKIKQAKINGLEMTFLSEKEKKALRDMGIKR
ncbi:hypothetical protein [Psychromonas hadalis]|nr:hypothetical protein [Psychromonas hadalis]